MTRIVRTLLSTLVFTVMVAGLIPAATAGAAASTSITITKYAADGTTILEQVEKDYTWMETNLAVYGDGVTRYYHQGPTFDPDNLWDPGKTVNVDNRDMGTPKGTDIRDLLNLAGTIPSGSEIEIKANDDYSKRFAYDDLKAMSGIRPVIAWFNADYGGYVPAYDTGMRLLFLNSETNSEGKFVYGNQDMKETLGEDYWHFFNQGGVAYPTSGGLSVQSIDRINIYTSAGSGSGIDILFEGTVSLTPGETFEVTAYNSDATYTVDKATPLGALQAAATSAGFTFDVTDRRYQYDQVLLLDSIGAYLRNEPGRWLAYVNSVYKDGYEDPADGLNIMSLNEGDRVEFYYTTEFSNPADLDTVKAAATAAVKTVASTGVAPSQWTLQLVGAETTPVTKSYFEEGLLCSSSKHKVSWTDDDGNIWAGVPLWLLVGMVDDNPDTGPDHFNFNDTLASRGYEINVISGDGWSAVLDSAAVARNNGYIVANTFNGEALPMLNDSGKPSWPLHLKGSEVFGGQQVGNIVRIELTSLPEPSEGWKLELAGDIGDTVSQAEFETILATTDSAYYREWTDTDGGVWSGIPLWVLIGAIDDKNSDSLWTLSAETAASGYTVQVVAADGFSKTFALADVAESDNYIVANRYNKQALSESEGPLRLVGPGVTKDDGSLGGSAVRNIGTIVIPELLTPEPAEGSWNLTLKGKISDVLSQAELEAGLACSGSGHNQQWTDEEGNVWSGIPLWLLAGWADDRVPHEFNANQAQAGYTILVKAADGYTKDFPGADVAWSNDYIIANRINGEELTGKSWPLRLVGAGVATEAGKLSGLSVSNIAEIELTGFGTSLPIPELRIVKYDVDRVTILKEMTVDQTWMEENLDVIGDGTTVYKFEGITNNPDDIWGSDGIYPGGFKIANAVKGTRIRDLCELVGGMGAATELILVASDGYRTILPYSSIYPDPWVQEKQGDAILAWFGDGEYAPYYKDGLRLFFVPEDAVYSQWDMHETLPENYWHYYYDGSTNTQYPSAAGLSTKWITTIEVYSIPEGDWTLVLDGRDIGGMYYEVSKTYMEQAVACQFGANHETTFTDAEGRVWGGIALWLLAGLVDDEDFHSSEAFNEALAGTGYSVMLTGADGTLVVIDSADIIKNQDFIVANTLDGVNLANNDERWPLVLVGPGVTGKTEVSRIERIELVPDDSPKLSGGKSGSSALPVILGVAGGVVVITAVAVTLFLRRKKAASGSAN